MWKANAISVKREHAIVKRSAISAVSTVKIVLG